MKLSTGGRIGLALQHRASTNLNEYSFDLFCVKRLHDRFQLYAHNERHLYSVHSIGVLCTQRALLTTLFHLPHKHANFVSLWDVLLGLSINGKLASKRDEIKEHKSD